MDAQAIIDNLSPLVPGASFEATSSVDFATVYVPGCPPRPESLIYGIVQLQRKIALQKLA